MIAKVLSDIRRKLRILNYAKKSALYPRHVDIMEYPNILQMETSL